MKQILKKVKEFQTAFKAPVNNRPTLLPEGRGELRWALMDEENNEYDEAVKNKDLIGIADALGDQLYILAGTIIEHGFTHIIEDVFNEIHESNMSKTDHNGKAIINGENGVYDSSRPLGKVLKSDKYFKPNIKAAIELGVSKAIERERSLRNLLDEAKGKPKAEDTLVYKEILNEEINYLTK